MVTMQELTAKKQGLEQELAQCRRLLEQYDTILNTKLQETEKQFERLAAEIKLTVDAIAAKQILKPLFTRYGNVMTVRNGWICISGTPGASVQYDRTTCFSVFADLKNKFLSTCNTIFSDWAGFQASGAYLQYLNAIACMYNSFLSMYMALPQMCQDARTDIENKLGAERAAAVEKENGLVAQLQWVEEQEIRLCEAAAELKKKTEFSDSMDCEREFCCDVKLPLGYNNESGGLLEWDLAGKNGVRLIVPKGRLSRRDPSVCRVVSNAVHHFFNRYPAGATRWALFDACKMRELRKLSMDLIDTSDSDDIAKIENAILYPCDSTGSASEIQKAFEEIHELIEGRDCLDMLLFNSEHPDSFQPIVLFVVYGATDAVKLKSEVANALGNARYHGVFLLVVEEAAESQADPYGYRQRMDEKTISDLRDMMTVTLLSDVDGDLDAECEGCVYRLGTPAQELDERRFAAQLKERILQQQAMAIPLDKLLDGYSRGRSDFSEVLQIPVGREDTGNVKVLSFSSNNATAHCAMTGETGSGKSSILQAIVLGGAYFYSPEEIEFYLIDMKDGAAFYSKGEFDYSQLKHVRMIAANCSVKDLRDFIQHILDNRLSKNEDGSGTNIVTYNKTRSGAERMKRTVIIIDEYTAITDQKCMEALERIAAQGRSYGISLILSSHKKGGSGVLDNVGNMIEMRSADVGGLIERGNVNRVRAADRVFLTALKGNCISASNEKKGISHFRAAYLSNLKQQKFIEKINEKYAEYQTPQTIIIGDTKRISARREDAESWTMAPEKSGAVCLAQIGHSLFGDAHKISFHEMQTQKLLMLGDSVRAQSIEYSLLSAARNGERYFLDFGGRASSVFQNVAEVANNEAAIEETLRDIYELYQSRKGRAWTDPVLVVMHDCAKCGDVLIRMKTRDASTGEKRTNAPVAVGVNIGEVSIESMNLSIDMPSMPAINLDSARLEQLAQKFSAEGRSENRSAAGKNAAGGERKYKDTKLAELFRELIQDGIRCGICMVVHSDFQGIENAAEIFGAALSKIFTEIIAVPSLEGEAVYAKNNLNAALQLTNATELKNVIERSACSNNERVRCYHIVNNDYMQFVPYEWE